MNITKRYTPNGKKPRYQVRIYIRGIRIRTKIFKFKEDAFIWYEEEKLLLKEELSKLTQESSSHYFSDCLKMFEEEAFTSIQEPTRAYYRSGFRYLIDSPIYNIKMDLLKSSHIHMWISWLKKQPTKDNVLRKSFKTELKLLSTILNWYKNFINEDFNVAITIKHRKACVFKPIPQRRPDYFMKPKEARSWLKVMENNQELPVYIRLATLMLLTGVRVSEACGACWDTVDLHEGTLRVVRTMRWDSKTRQPHLVETTKTTSSNRLILLHKPLVKMLREIKKENPKSPFLFTKNGNDPLHYGTIQKVFNRGFKSLNLPWRSTHILRHSYATIALLATKDLPSVQASLGHRSIKVTEKYAKAIASLSRDTARKTSKMFDLFDEEESGLYGGGKTKSLKIHCEINSLRDN